MIIRKSPAEIEAMKEAGRVSAKVLREVGAQVRPGVSTLELDELAEALIRAEGGIPAFKGYGGFPGSICASVNEQIVHGIPSRGVVLKEGRHHLHRYRRHRRRVGGRQRLDVRGGEDLAREEAPARGDRAVHVGRTSTPRDRAIAWATSAMPCRASPKTPATA